MYGQVVLWQNQSKKSKEENLPKAVGKKVTFQQLVVCYNNKFPLSVYIVIVLTPI